MTPSDSPPRTVAEPADVAEPSDVGAGEPRAGVATQNRGAETVPAAGDRLTALLASSAIGVYLLIVVGATTALLDGAGSCTTWPACQGAWLPAFADPAMVVAWSHRVATLLVGLLLLVTAWTAVRGSGSRRVGAGLLVAVLLYPAQIAIGALTVGGAATTALTALHLVVALTIFSAVLLALLWHLEAVTPTAARATEGGVGATSGAPSASIEPADGRGPALQAESRTSLGQPSATAPDSPTTPAEMSATPAQTPSTAEEAPSAPAEAGGGTEGSPTQRERALGYLTLTKPKLWWLLCLVAVAAMGLADGPALEPGVVAATVTGGVLAIAASGTFNHVLERDLDRRMSRTDDRPLVEGFIPVRRALAFGLVLAAGSVGVFLAFVNVLAAALGVMAILFYAVGYTLVLKPNTSQNIVLGGAVGAFPALIGWAAVERTVGLPALVLGAVIFLWTPAHFYNLALAYREDYARAGVPMLPVVRGAAVTRRHILGYLGATMIAAVLLGTTVTLGWLYALTATVAGGGFLWAVVRLHRERTEGAAFRAFHASNAYLGSLLLVVTVDALLV